MTEEEPCGRLEGLPAEILLNIMSNLPDLLSLRSLIHASPQGSRVFDGHAAEVTDSVLDCVSRTGFMTVRIPELIRVMVLIRSSALPLSSLEDFNKRFVSQSLRQARDSSKFLPRSIPRSTPPAVLRSILASAHQISQLTLFCLQHHLAQLVSIKPQRLVNAGFRYGSGNGPADAKMAAWARRPEGRGFEIREAGPPTWVEEQRVMRALWRVQFFYDLKAAARQSRLAWPREDLLKVDCMEWPVDLYDNVCYNEFEEICTVEDWLEVIRTDDDLTVPRRGCQLPLLRKPIIRPWPTPVPKPNEHFSLVLLASAWSFWRGLSLDLFSPLQHVPYRPFRRLGFSIWEQERMAVAELLPPPNQRFGEPLDCYYFTWRSILAEEDIQDAEKTQREVQEEADGAYWPPSVVDVRST